MTAQPRVQTDVSPTIFAELSSVSLIDALEVDEGTLPAGSRGTIVAAYADRLGYEVEFDHPFHALVTLSARALGA